MLLFKKINWKKTKIKNSKNDGCIEKDAVSVTKNNMCQQHINNNSESCNVEPSTNIQNANQQIVMQISHSNGFHLGNVVNIYKNGDGQQYLPKTTTIVTMMESKEEPAHCMLNTIATHLGDGWKMVMRELGFSDGEISQAMIDHHLHGHLKEVIYQLLLEWVRNAEDEIRTIGFITKLLWEYGHRDCVYRMKDTWKNHYPII